MVANRWTYLHCIVWSSVAVNLFRGRSLLSYELLDNKSFFWNLFRSAVPYIVSGVYSIVLVAQSCLILSDPMDCSPRGSSAHEIFPGKDTGVGCHFLLQGIFPTQGSNPGLLHCGQILYRLSYKGNLMYTVGIWQKRKMNEWASQLEIQKWIMSFLVRNFC